jgi:hypothetical protein
MDLENRVKVSQSGAQGVQLMKVIAFNGSPRKKWNTATLLEKALEGAASQGAETELIHPTWGLDLPRKVNRC